MLSLLLTIERSTGGLCDPPPWIASLGGLSPKRDHRCCEPCGLGSCRKTSRTATIPQANWERTRLTRVPSSCLSYHIQWCLQRSDSDSLSLSLSLSLCLDPYATRVLSQPPPAQTSSLESSHGRSLLAAGRRLASAVASSRAGTTRAWPLCGGGMPASCSAVATTCQRANSDSAPFWS